MSQGINIGGIYADLDLNTGNLERGLAKGRQAMDAAESELRKLQAEFKRGAIDFNIYNARAMELGRVMTDLAAKMQAANAALGVTGNGFGVFNAGLNNATNAAERFGRGLMQVGYIADDIQYGLSSIVNNIGPMVSAFGGTAGMAGGIQIAAVAANQLYRHWDDLLGLFGNGKVETEAEEMERLGKATKLTADEAERLARYKALENKTAELRGAKTKSEKKSEDTATETIVEAGVKNVVTGVLASDKAAVTKLGASSEVDADPEVQKARKALDEAKAGTLSRGKVQVRTVNPEAITKAEEDLLKAQRAAAEKITSAATLTNFYGPERLLEMVRRNPENFKEHAEFLREGLEKSVKEAAVTPEDRRDEAEAKAKAKAMKASDALDKKFAAEQAKVDREKAARDKKEAGITKTLNDEGVSGKLHGDAEQKQRDREEEQEEKRFTRESVEKAKKAVPGLDKSAEEAVMGAKVFGGSMHDVWKKLAKEFSAKGLTDDEAIAAADETLADAKQKVNDKVANWRPGKDDDRPEVSRSEVLATSSLTQRVQSGVSNGQSEAKKQVDLQTQMVAYLQAIEKQKALRIEVRK